MDLRLKQRLVGAIVIVALLVIFAPMLLNETVEREITDIPLDIPPKPVVVPPGIPDPEVQEQLVVDSESTLTQSTPIYEAPDVAVQERGQPQEQQATVKQPAPEKNSASAKQMPPVVGIDEPVEKTRAGPDELATWVVQVGSFGTESNALRLRDRLREAGFPAFVDSISDSKQQAFYRVRVGPVAKRPEAEALQARLLKQESVKGIVTAHP